MRQFYFKLCLALKISHPDYLIEQLSYRQLTEWMAYDKLSPIGDYKLEYGFAQLCSLINNILTSRWGKKGSKLKSINDFVPKWGMKEEKKEQKQQSVDEMKSILFSLAGKNKK